MNSEYAKEGLNDTIMNLRVEKVLIVNTYKIMKFILSIHCESSSQYEE